MQELQSLIQQYDPQTERWSLFGELPFPLKGAYFYNYFTGFLPALENRENLEK